MLPASLAAADPPKAKEAEAAVPDRATLEKRFSELLSNATMLGTYTTDGVDMDKPPKPDGYEIESATKLDKGDYWVILAKMKYGENSVKIPVTVRILWAGDTPVLTLTDLTIPGLGTFTCRLLFYGDRYAGTWQHGDHGGHMWGKIEKTKKTESPEKPAAEGQKKN
jgi:hypothetical protein